MEGYTVQQLAKLAKVSVRTRHHYDHIDLLKPASRTAAGYRLYASAELRHLQQILFFRELDFPLKDIRRILSDSDFNAVETLKSHRRLLTEQRERLSQLLQTLDKTILDLTEEQMTMTDDELYEGFSKEKIERYKREVREKYDPDLVAESNRRVKKMSKAQWQAVQADGEAVTREMAALAADHAPDDPTVQAVVARHHAWIENFYPCNAATYAGLGQLYTDNPEFRAHYDKYRPDLAEFMRAAMEYFAEHTLSES